MAFDNLHPKIKKWLKKKGYLEGTLPQKLAIPEIMDEGDVLIIAPTGHGKTLAAVLPIFDMLLKEKKKEKIRALYITPLKSLNRDVWDRIVQLASFVGLEVDLRHGDTTQKERKAQVDDPADVVVITPETLQAVLTGKKLRELLKNVNHVIIDEIHELCENKRGTQMTLALERLKFLAGDFQRIGISATIGDPNEISQFLTKKDCKIIDARAEKEYEIDVEHPKPTKEDKILAGELNTIPNVAYCLRRMKELIESSRSTIIFVNTRETAESLASRFKKWVPEFPIAVHHSSLSKDVRINVENQFKNNELKAIISTSSLELGIDVGTIDLVIQYGSPRQATKLIQRIGRSGHGVGRISKGKIICSTIDDYLEAYAIYKKSEEGWLEKPKIPQKPYDVLAHQIVGICMDFQKEDKTPKKKEIFDIVKNAYPYRNLKVEEFDGVIDIIRDIYLIQENEKGFYRTRKGLLYYFKNLSTIPDEKNYIVVAADLNKRIGVLHQGFVAQFIKRNAEFIMKGEPWKVVEREDNIIKVISSKGTESSIPSWEGELIPVYMEVAKLCGDLREKFEFKELKMQKENFVVPTSKNMFIESFENYVILHSCFGNKVNQTLAKFLGAIISSKVGSTVGIRSDTYRIMFKMPELFGQDTILETINEIEPEWIDDILKKSMKNATIFNFRFYQIAKRFGAIDRDADFSHYMISKLIDVYQNTPLYHEAINEVFREKLDVENTKDLLKKIKSGRINIKTSSGYEVSPLGAEGLDYSSVSLVKPSENISEIYNTIKQRLLKRRFWFACLKCKNSLGTYTYQSVPENLKCNKCESKLIGFIPAKDMELAKKVLVKDRNKLNAEEKKLLKNFEETAEMFISRGKIVVFVLAGYGIGPATAKRILSRINKSEEELIKDIAEAERNFIRTRMFWE